MEPRNIFTARRCLLHLGNDVVQGQRRRVNDARARRAMGEDGLRHERSCVETNRAPRDEIASAHGDEICGTWAGADEVYGHGPSPSAMAQVTVGIARRAARRRAPRPAAAKAAVSATEGTPFSASTRADAVRALPETASICEGEMKR